MTSDDFRRFWTPQPTLKLDVINGRSLKRAHRMTSLEGLCCCPLLLLLFSETLQVVLLFQEQTTDIH